MSSKRLVLLALCLSLASCKAEPQTTFADPSVPCWGGQELGTHGTREFFCESNRRACVAQPVNTWSNVGYLAVAGTIWSSTRRRQARRLAERVFGALVVAESLYLGIASGLFHASITHWAERLDLSATYGVLLALLGYAATLSIGPTKPRVVFGIATSLVGVQVLITIFKYRMHDFIVFPFVLTALTGSLITLVRRGVVLPRHLFRALGAVIAGIVVWALDLSRVACRPDALMQGHAAWHLLTAVAVLFAFVAIEEGSQRAYGSSTSAPNASGT